MKNDLRSLLTFLAFLLLLCQVILIGGALVSRHMPKCMLEERTKR